MKLKGCKYIIDKEIVMQWIISQWNFLPKDIIEVKSLAGVRKESDIYMKIVNIQSYIREDTNIFLAGIWALMVQN